MNFLENELQKKGMKFGYPKLNIKKISSFSSSSFLKNKKNIVSLEDFMK